MPGDGPPAGEGRPPGPPPGPEGALPTARHAELAALLYALAQELGGFSSRLATQMGLHPTDLDALQVLHASGADGAGEPLTVGELGARLRLSSAAVTGLVDRLERVGHVERVRDAADRRRVRLRATLSSREATSAALQPFLDRLDATLDGFDDAERDAARRFLLTALEVIAGSGDAPGSKPGTPGPGTSGPALSAPRPGP